MTLQPKLRTGRKWPEKEVGKSVPAKELGAYLSKTSIRIEWRFEYLPLGKHTAEGLGEGGEIEVEARSLRATTNHVRDSELYSVAMRGVES